MNLRADEISSIIKQQIRDYDKKTECSESGTVIVVGDGIARAQGLEKCMANELLEFEGGGYGMALNLEEYTVSIVLLDNSADIREGTVVKRTGKVVSVPVGEGLLGRVVNALGAPIDGKGPVQYTEYRPVEHQAPGIIKRKSVSVPLQTSPALQSVRESCQSFWSSSQSPADRPHSDAVLYASLLPPW